jgi:hypothetical protein
MNDTAMLLDVPVSFHSKAVAQPARSKKRVAALSARQLRLDEPKPRVRTAFQKREYWIDRWDVSQGRIQYDPRECRRRILSCLNDTDWTDFFDVCDAAKMPVRAVDHMLDLLISWGRIEDTELYFWQGGYSMKRPPMSEYRGFCFGYRLKGAAE